MPELLAPAGNREKLEAAIRYGADAVYMAADRFGMRAFAGNFTPEEIPQAVKFAHDHGVKAHAAAAPTRTFLFNCFFFTAAATCS